MRSHNYCVYIATNPNRTVLYTGITNNLERRMNQHLEDAVGRRKSFAGKYFCYNLIYYEWFPYVHDAISREKEIKGWTRAKKEALIAAVNPNWIFLNSLAAQEKGEVPDWY
jgi:putative endonuclease